MAGLLYQYNIQSAVEVCGGVVWKNVEDSMVTLALTDTEYTASEVNLIFLKY